MQFDFDTGVGRRKALDVPGEYIQGRGFSRCDIQFTGFQTAKMCIEAFLQSLDAVHQGFGDLVQYHAFRRECDPGTAAFEKHDIHVTFERLYLQGDCRLTEKQGFCSLEYTACPGSRTERPQLF